MHTCLQILVCMCALCNICRQNREFTENLNAIHKPHESVICCLHVEILALNLEFFLVQINNLVCHPQNELSAVAETDIPRKIQGNLMD